LLNIFVYLINDYCDIELDLASPDRRRSQVEFLAANRPAAMGAMVVLRALLLALSAGHLYLWKTWLLPIAVTSSSIVIIVYSAWLKHYPIWDVVLMVVAGATGTIIGVGEWQIGWRLVVILALFCGCIEVIQTIRDEPVDRSRGVRTTAVLLGPKRAAWIFRLMMFGAALHGIFVIGSYFSAALLVLVALPFTPQKASRSWDMVRILAGTVWLALMIQLYLGRLH
jgi:4-hydroxybenzoate polyprenyltransferase